ncbi:MAG: hypothetical protein AAFX85_03765 [Pseudomonadota bacterium]
MIPTQEVPPSTVVASADEYASLRTVALGIVGDLDVAEDAVQEAIIACWQGAGVAEGGASTSCIRW